MHVQLFITELTLNVFHGHKLIHINKTVNFKEKLSESLPRNDRPNQASTRQKLNKLINRNVSRLVIITSLVQLNSATQPPFVLIIRRHQRATAFPSLIQIKNTIQRERYTCFIFGTEIKVDGYFVTRPHYTCKISEKQTLIVNQLASRRFHELTTLHSFQIEKKIRLIRPK